MKIVDPGAVGLSSTRLERVGGWLHRQVAVERLAGASVLIGRRGQIAYFDAAGQADQENAVAFDADTVVRIYSMTKPITTVAAMMLYERGAFQLDDPIAKFLPAFSDVTVWKGGDAPLSETTPAERPITVRQVITHTAGFTYGFMRANVVDEAYRESGVELPGSAGSLAEWSDMLAALPLIAQPGAQWNYSVATDVLGRLVEVWSGRDLANFLQTEIFAPVGMVDTAFNVPSGAESRFASLYAPPKDAKVSPMDPSGQGLGLRVVEPAAGSPFLSDVAVYSGGGGLVGTIHDYARFCRLLLGGGVLEGTRLLSPKTVAYMLQNQLPEGRDMAAMGQPVWSETSYEGIGFGLGGAVVIDPVKAHVVTSPGEYHWGGAASTFFWVDPVEDLFVVFFTQLAPSSTYPLRRELRTAVYQALVD